MPRKVDALRVKMTPAARARAAQRAERMLAEIQPQVVEIYSNDRIREFDQTDPIWPKV